MAKEIQSVCNYCGVGCNVVYHQSDDGKTIEKVTGAKEYPVNKGVLCPKGFKIHEPILSDERGKYPLIKKDGALQRASWDEAIGLFTDKVKKIQEEHGKGSVAFISTGQMYTESMALLGQVGRTGMGMHGDGNTRQCMASAVVGYKKSFGFDSPPMTYKDIEESDCIVVIGSNMPIAHPIVWNRIKNNPHNPDIVVIDPRYTEAAKKSSLHIPIQPKKDLIFLYMVMNKLIANNWIDKEYIEAHTNGFDDIKKVMSEYDPNDVEKMTGITAVDFDAFVSLMRTKKRVTMWWTMGVNQSHMGTRTAQAIINLCLITGNVGKPGAGPCSLTGQANAMGSRMFSNTTSLFGGRNYENPADRAFVGKALDLDPDRLPKTATMPYDKIISGIEEGSIKGLWIVYTNPMHSWINNTKLKRTLDNLELLVVQDIYPTTLTAQHASIYLPATGIGESNGFLINSERRLSIAQKVMDSPGEALSDFEIFQRIAKSYGCEDVIKGWDNPEAVFQLLKKTSEGMPCDITGIRDYQHIIEKGGIQWPYPKDNPDEATERRLFEDGKFFTPDGKAKLEAEAFVDTTNVNISDQYPLYLLTGRGSIVQYQTNTRTSKSPILHKQVSETVYVEINKEDADVLEVSNGDKVKVSSASHSIQAIAKVTDAVFPGYVFIPFHYPEANNVVEAENFDAYSRQPSFKTGAVRIEAA